MVLDSLLLLCLRAVLRFVLHHRIFLYTCIVTYVFLFTIYPFLLLSLYYFIFYYYKCNKCNTIPVSPLFIGVSGVTLGVTLDVTQSGKKPNVTLSGFARVVICHHPFGVDSATIGVLHYSRPSVNGKV